MTSLNISGGQINVMENTVPIYLNVLGEQLYISLKESEVLLYNMILTNIELFGKPYWDILSRKSNLTLDYQFREMIDKNIVSWSRDKKLESIL
jgi:hypothetical protein